MLTVAVTLSPTFTLEDDTLIDAVAALTAEHKPITAKAIIAVIITFNLLFILSSIL
jgi:hypothetical protein